MKILVDSNNVIMFKASEIAYGTFESEEKWKMSDVEGTTLMYAIDNSYTVAEITEDIENFETGKYMYASGTILQNPDWVEHKTDEERIAELEAEMAEKDATIAAMDEVMTELLTVILPSLTPVE